MWFHHWMPLGLAGCDEIKLESRRNEYNTWVHIHGMCSCKRVLLPLLLLLLCVLLYYCWSSYCCLLLLFVVVCQMSKLDYAVHWIWFRRSCSCHSNTTYSWFIRWRYSRIHGLDLPTGIHGHTRIPGGRQPAAAKLALNCMASYLQHTATPS